MTKVYNKRFFDEMAFCNCQNHHIMNNVAFIVMDLHDFKIINDNYGHLTGDCVLKQVGEVLKNNIRAEDYAIRMGGDEFLIILENCDEEMVLKKIKQFKEKLKEIVYDKENNLYIEGHFGFSITNSFNNTNEFIIDMLKKADFHMYLSKNHNKKPRK